MLTPLSGAETSVTTTSTDAQPAQAHHALPRPLDRVFAAARDRGIDLRLTERHTILASPAERLDDDFRHLLRRHRDAIIDHLMAQRGVGSADLAEAADSGKRVFDGTHARVIAGSSLPVAALAPDPPRLVLARPAALGGAVICVAPDNAVGVGFHHNYLDPNTHAGSAQAARSAQMVPVYFQSELALIRQGGDEWFAAFHPQRTALLTLWEPWTALTDWELVALGKKAGLGRYATLRVVEHLLRACLAMEWIVWNQQTTTLLRPRRLSKATGRGE